MPAPIINNLRTFISDQGAEFKMHRIINIFTWIFMMFFLAPTLMIMVSWNALPGDALFGMKLAMERSVAVLLSASYSQRTALEAQYTQRRFNEAHTLIAQRQSAGGLSYLSDQVTTTKNAIDNSKDARSKAEISEAYIAALNDVYNQLEEDKQQLSYTPNMPSVTSDQPTSAPQGVGSVRTLPKKAPVVSRQTTTNPPPQTNQTQTVVRTVYVTTQIIQTQEIIRQTIVDLNQNTQSPANPSPTPTQPIPTNTRRPTPSPTTEPDLRLRAEISPTEGAGFAAPLTGSSPTSTPVPTVPPAATSTPAPTLPPPTSSPVPPSPEPT